MTNPIESQRNFGELILTDTRPHPGPLPRGEGESSSVFWQIARGWKQSPLDGGGGGNSANHQASVPMLFPLLGERVRVRASPKTDFNHFLVSSGFNPRLRLLRRGKRGLIVFQSDEQTNQIAMGLR